MNFYDTVNAAVLDIALHGYDSQARIDQWVQRIEAAARASLVPPDVLERALRANLMGTYARLVDKGGLLKTHKGVARFTLDRVRPQLRAELDRRIAMSAQLIKLNRSAMIAKTTQRFTGWASSVPPGGSDAVDRRETTGEIRKALGQLPFEERRVMTDQGHKLIGDINNIVAVAGGAIAAQWRSHWRQGCCREPCRSAPPCQCRPAWAGWLRPCRWWRPAEWRQRCHQPRHPTGRLVQRASPGQ